VCLSLPLDKNISIRKSGDEKTQIMPGLIHYLSEECVAYSMLLLNRTTFNFWASRPCGLSLGDENLIADAIDSPDCLRGNDFSEGSGVVPVAFEDGRFSSKWSATGLLSLWSGKSSKIGAM
jgi:hypothetical protein